jgi:hypothetical protein
MKTAGIISKAKHGSAGKGRWKRWGTKETQP